MSDQRIPEGIGQKRARAEYDKSIAQPSNIQLATTIKQMHSDMRKFVATRQTASSITALPENIDGADITTPTTAATKEGCSTEAEFRECHSTEVGAWNVFLQEHRQGLVEYSECMMRLATEHWDPLGCLVAEKNGEGSHRYSDRLALVTEFIGRYFSGDEKKFVTSTPTVIEFAKKECGGPVPLMCSSQLRNKRRQYFEANAVSIDDAAFQGLIVVWLRERVQACPSSSAGWVLAQVSEEEMEAPPKRKIDFLDVGSCYNPFRKALSNDIVEVTALDLQPCHGHDVLRCDFTQIVIAPSDGDTIKEGPCCSVLHAASFDVVCFSLVLSFLPTSALRYLMCTNAFRCLRPDGVLLVVSTKTQGSRCGSWVSNWCTAIESIGFQLAGRSIRVQLILLAFRRGLQSSPSFSHELSQLLQIGADNLE